MATEQVLCKECTRYCVGDCRAAIDWHDYRMSSRPNGFPPPYHSCAIAHQPKRRFFYPYGLSCKNFKSHGPWMLILIRHGREKIEALCKRVLTTERYKRLHQIEKATAVPYDVWLTSWLYEILAGHDPEKILLWLERKDVEDVTDKNEVVRTIQTQLAEVKSLAEDTHSHNVELIEENAALRQQIAEMVPIIQRVAEANQLPDTPGYPKIYALSPMCVGDARAVMQKEKQGDET